ncbi:MAG: hypothetical protein IRZ16_16265 [Myxococcaceae bacterium]|nr:hypothetical protein [Myxococcaceae bacterium]
MKFPLFSRRENSRQAQLEAQARFERALAEGLRALGTLFSRAAEVIEAQRLQREGYGEQEKYLERLDSPATSAEPRTR